ncbi:putative RNA recognition domain containing protein [Blattamonas nauphoetae]|uniref:RNA recognition domain containing protein n=1 Tax=Blattamonas nauphoetae TaxID=2049346 RepID=A0ABQ9YLU5_9EUKA|nr:putative RNA recognition domain containing protein [Blattamonas nauphoetae]
MTRRIFCGNLNFNTTAQSLGQLFESVGVVQNATIVSRFNKSLGYGFVEMASDTEAQYAASALNGQELDGRVLIVELAHSAEERKDLKKERRMLGMTASAINRRKRDAFKRHAGKNAPQSPIRVYMGNLPDRIEERHLLEAFKDMAVTEVMIAKKPGGKPMGHAFVSFLTHEDQLKALAMNGYLIIGKNLVTIEPAKVPGIF